MATIVLTALGTAIGGPFGGAIGGLLGREVDRAVFGGVGSREGPRLKDLSVTTSSYGQPMPRHFGRMRVAGSIIWATDLIESSEKQGGGKGQPSTTTYSYSSSFAVALSSNPISGIGRIWADGNLLRGAGGDLKVGGQLRFYNGSGSNGVDPLIAADKGSETPGFRDCAYVVFEDLQLGDFGNRIPALTFEVFALDDTQVSLADLVPTSKGGEDNLLLDYARGFADEGGPIRNSLSSIDRIYPLSCTNDSGELAIVSRFAVPEEVITLPEQLSDQDAAQADLRIRQRANGKVPEPVALRYYDEERDYQPSVQRALAVRAEGRELIVDLPAAMRADGAKQLANENAQRARWHHEKITWRIGQLDPGIRPGVTVRVPDQSGNWLITSWEWHDGGIELGLERLPYDIQSTKGGVAGTANTPPDEVVPETELAAFELPPEDVNDSASARLFAAATAANRAWRGAALYLEQGTALTPIGQTGVRRAISGTLSEPLAASDASMLEPNAQLTLKLTGQDLNFAETDVVGMAAGTNRLRVGEEVLQFLWAGPLGEGMWRLSGLLRGRAATEAAAASGHPVGTQVVLIDDRLTRLDSSIVPSSAATRIAAIGLNDSEPVFADLQNAGGSRRPPSPVHPRVRWLAESELELCWIRRARGYWRWEDLIEAPLVEQEELYQVGYGPTDVPHSIWATNEPRFTLTASERTSLLTDYGPASLWVRQVGTYSISEPLFLTSIQ